MSYIELLAEGIRKNRMYERYGRENSLILGSKALASIGVKIGGFKGASPRA